jgi:hypothetical protein
MSSKKPSNPYAAAASAYGNSRAAAHAGPARDGSARLLKAAQMFKDLQENWGDANLEVIEATLKYNRNIWLMFYDTAVENTEGNRPRDLRSEYRQPGELHLQARDRHHVGPEKGKARRA